MATVLADFPSILHSHCIFFDKLVELVPAKFYIPSEGHQDTWTYGKSKAARAAARKVTKDNLKKAKRNRLDRDKFATTLQILQQQEKSHPENAETVNFTTCSSSEGVNRAVTYVELKERLHKRIEILRAKRHADEAAEATRNARSWQNEKKKDTLNRCFKMLHSQSGTSVTETREEQSVSKRHKRASETTVGIGNVDEVAEQLEFSRVKMGIDNGFASGDRKRRKESKEILLKKATELEMDMQDPEHGREVITRHSWSAAVSRASGDRVLDNPRLLKTSLRKEKQQQSKSARKWQERKEFERKAAQEKQDKRFENIAQRIQATKDRKISKREKKLMRPGFEGRKEGFINT